MLLSSYSAASMGLTQYIPVCIFLLCILSNREWQKLDTSIRSENCVTIHVLPPLNLTDLIWQWLGPYSCLIIPSWVLSLRPVSSHENIWGLCCKNRSFKHYQFKSPHLGFPLSYPGLIWGMCCKNVSQCMWCRLWIWQENPPGKNPKTLYILQMQ